MNQNFAIELSDTICSSCYCGDHKFLHHVWVKNNARKICTSCVLHKHREFFCPSCFDLIVEPCKPPIRCCICECGTCPKCFSGDVLDFKCLACTNADHLIFRLKEVKRNDDNGFHKVMDWKAARMLLTAAKIVNNLISKACDESVNSVEKQATVVVSSREEATRAVEPFVKFEECGGPSLLDGSPSASRRTAN